VYGATSGPATSTGLADATAVAVAADGSILIADDNTDRVRMVDPAGTLTTVAGSGTPQLLVTVGSSVCPNPDERGQWYAMDLIPFIGHLTAPAGKAIHVTFETSLTAWIAVTVSRRGRPITQMARTFRTGTHTVALRRAPAPGSYDVRVSGTTRLDNRQLHNCAESFLNVVRRR